MVSGILTGGQEDAGARNQSRELLGGEGGEAGGERMGLMAWTEEILVALGPTPASLV